MRSRWVILAAALLFAGIATAPALAASPYHVVTQIAGGDAEPATGSKAEADAGPPAEPEAGPPWTFQMARISIALSILLALAIGRWYWKLVGSRQKGTA